MTAVGEAAVIPSGSIGAHPFVLAWLRAASGNLPMPMLPGDSGEWPAIIDSAASHGLAPLLYRHLCREGASPIPAEVRTALQVHSAATAARNLWLFEEFVRIEEQFARRAIPFIPLRGIFLSHQLYDDITVRPTGDIDLLVSRDALPAVRAVMTALGLMEVEAREGFAERFYYTLEFFKSAPMPLIVEPHWSLAYPPFVDAVSMAFVWGRAAWTTINDRWFLTLGREDLLLHLCLHLLHHVESAPLLWYAELNRIIRDDRPLDWPLFLSLVQAAGLEPLIVNVLRRLERQLLTPVPEYVISRLSSGPSRMQPDRFIRLAVRSPEARGSEKIMMLWSLKGIRAKFRYLLAFLFPSLTFIRAQYGVSSGWQVGVVYVRRLLTLTWEGCKTLAKLMTASSS